MKPVDETSSSNLSSKLVNVDQGTQTTRSNMSSHLQNMSQNASTTNVTRADDAYSVNTAICDLFKRKCDDEITAIQHVQTALRNALDEVVLTDHTRLSPEYLHQHCANHIKFLNTHRAPDTNASGAYTLSDTEQFEVESFRQAHAHNASINEGPIVPYPHDIAAEVRVHNWLTVSAALTEKAEAEMSTSKDYVFACLRDQRSTENVPSRTSPIPFSFCSASPSKTKARATHHPKHPPGAWRNSLGDRL